MKSLETKYNGFRFRSRLEARWAVFMDAMGVKYEYEPEAYDLDGLCYLPDFWLPQMKAHLEIKPSCTNPEDWEKAKRLAKHSRLPVYVICGQPECPDIWDNWYKNESSATIIMPLEGNEVGEDHHYLWCECKQCHRCELQFDGRAGRIECGCSMSGEGSKNYNFDSPRLQSAYAKARGYRFEPGAINSIGVVSRPSVLIPKSSRRVLVRPFKIYPVTSVSVFPRGKS